MALTTASALVAASVSSLSMPFVKAAATAAKASQIESLWNLAGTPPAATVPTAYSSGGQILTTAISGCFPIVYPSSGALYVVKSNIANGTYSASSLGSTQFLLMDLLWACSGMSGIVTTAQTVVSPPTLTRYTSGVGVEIYLVWFTATGATACTATVSYQNQANATSSSGAQAVTASASANCVQPIPLAAGDTGVLAINSVTLSVTTGTAGNFGVLLVKRLAALPFIQLPSLQGNSLSVTDYLQTGLAQIQSNAHLTLFSSSPSNAQAISGTLGLAIQ